MSGTMGSKHQRAGWWILVGATLVAVVLSLIATRRFSADNLVLGALYCYGLVGAVVARRRAETPIGWIFLLVGLLAGLAGVATAAGQSILDAGAQVPWWGMLSAWYITWWWYPLVMLATTFTFLLFPSGLLSPRWRPVLRLAVATTFALTLFETMSPTLELSRSSGGAPVMIANPLSPQFLENVDLEATWWFLTTAILALFCGLASIVSAVLRSRRAQGAERQQMRLFGFASLSLPVLFVLSSWVIPFGAVLGNVLFTAAVALIPLSCGVAIMRYRLYDIDRIIGRTTAYGLVTGVLLAVYAAVVTSVTALLPGSGDAAVAAATLAAAAAFRPVLRWARRLVDRRFNREQYDAERMLEQFAVRLRGQVEGDEVVEDLLAVLDRTVQPRAAGIWLREAST